MTDAQGGECLSKMVTFSHCLPSIKRHLLNAKALRGAEGATHDGKGHKSGVSQCTHKRAELILK